MQKQGCVIDMEKYQGLLYGTVKYLGKNGKKPLQQYLKDCSLRVPDRMLTHVKV